MTRRTKFGPAVVLINFNRPDLTKIAVSRLASVGARNFYLSCDGPRDGVESDIDLVCRTRQLLELSVLPGPKHLIFADSNLGVKNNVLNTLDFVFTLETQAIILEDDCFVDPSFFTFAEKALNEFVQNPQVSIISAHNPMPNHCSNEVRWDPLPRIWGWATWQDRWVDFRESMPLDFKNPSVTKSILRRIPSLTARFQFRQLASNENAQRNWDIGFAAKQIFEDRLAVSANVNLVANLGFDSRGTNANDWGELELPNTRPVVNELRLSTPRLNKRQFFFEDIRRLSRWSLAACRRPHAAYRKVTAIFAENFKSDHETLQ